MLNFSLLSLALLQFTNIVIVQIFDEILVNAADNKQRDKKMDTIKIDIKPEENMIKVSDVSFLLTTFPHTDNYMRTITWPVQYVRKLFWLFSGV